MTQEKRNHDAVLVTLADRNFIDQAKQLFSSVYWNAGWKGDYMLLAHKIPEKDLKWFRDKGILVKKCRPIYNKEVNGINPLVYDKIYLFSQYFNKWRKIIYLDADMIVLKSLDQLKGVKYFGAVEDFYPYGKLKFQLIKNRIFKDEREVSFINKYNLEDHPFNAGLLVLDGDMASMKKFQELINFSKEHENIARLAEQSILNLYFYKKWEKLPPQYNANYFNPPNRRMPPIKDAIILHHWGLDKPWSPRNPFYKLWREYLDKADEVDLNDRLRLDNSFKHNLNFYYGVYLITWPFGSLLESFKKRSNQIMRYLLRLIGKVGIFIRANKSFLKLMPPHRSRFLKIFDF